ncbi:MAG: hypothetical protein K0S47_3138 [Herbinix sp.]|jgi:hypothetical protein|nr:hypothetical protein [Herbinix sp.]
MKRFLKIAIVLFFVFSFATPVKAAPEKTGGFTPAGEAYGAQATAQIIKQKGNTNTLNITVTMNNSVVAFDSFDVSNNAAGEYEVGAFKVYVSTYGNDKIDVTYITDVTGIPLFYDTAKEMMADWLNVYLKQDSANGTYSTYYWSDRSNNGEETGFWQAANVYELLNDAYEHTQDPMYKVYMDGYRARFLDGHFSWSGTWLRNEYSDDLLWWSNAFIRTSMLTGDVSYLTLGEEIFERVYTRAWDTRETCPYTGVPGGVLWKFDLSDNPVIKDNIGGTNEKNVATNGNAVLAASRLARIYKENGDVAKSQLYAERAEKIYTWMYQTMVIDKNIGKLTDNYNITAGRRDWQFSYNYGLFAGAAYEMWVNTGDVKYLEQAKLVLNYGWTTLTISDGLTFKDEGGMDGSDGASFRIVLARNTGHLVKDPEFAGFMKYMQANAYQSYKNRRASDGLVGSNLVTKPLDGVRIPSPIAAFGVAMQWYSGFSPNITYGFEGTLREVPAWGENGIYLAELAKRANVNFSFVGWGAPAAGSAGMTHSVFWDEGGSDNNPNGTSRYLEFEVKVPEAGLYQLDLRWFTRGNNSRRMKVNDGAMVVLNFNRTAENVWENLTTSVNLKAGTNTIKIWNHRNEAGVTQDNWLFLDYIKVGAKIGEYVEETPQYTEDVYLVDNATRSNVEYSQAGGFEYRPGGLGSGHIVYWDKGGNGYVEFTVTVEKAGLYEMSFGWFTRGNDNIGRRLTINGVNSTLRFTDGGNVWTETFFEGELKAGTNTIRLSYDRSIDSETWLLLDHLTVKVPIN